MLQYHCDHDHALVELNIDGPVTAAELDDLWQKLEADLARHGKLSVLKVVHRVGRIEPAAIWHNARLGFRHMRDWRRVAAVADKRWMHVIASVWKPLLPFEMRLFPLDRIDEARQWLLAADQSQAA